jgi:hypothetical protein
MNARILDDATATATPILSGSEQEPESDHGEWPSLLTLAHVRMAGLIRDNCELRARLGLLSPLLADWPEYDAWAAAAREYHANRQQGGGR